MITNILATITILIVTNSYHPKEQVLQYQNLLPFDQQTLPAWQQGGFTPTMTDYVFQGQTWEKENTKILIVEVRQIRKISFEFEGKTLSAELENKLISQKRRRKVIDERWEDE